MFGLDILITLVKKQRKKESKKSMILYFLSHKFLQISLADNDVDIRIQLYIF